MPIWIWLTTLLKGFLPIDGKRIGKIIWVLALCAIAIGVYHKQFVEKTTKIEKIENYYACPQEEGVLGIKFNIWKLHLKMGI
jgi:hypothetical protein